jgi:hypothetical protein
MVRAYAIIPRRLPMRIGSQRAACHADDALTDADFRADALTAVAVTGNGVQRSPCSSSSSNNECS